jgi:cyclohexanecarboxyl-CoA dehydrogenase
VDFTLSDEDELFARTLRDYARDRLRPNVPRWRTEPFPRELLGELGDLGVLGLKVPEEYGGSDATYVAAGVAAEELSRGDLNVSYFVQLSTIGAGLLATAAESIRREWLPAIASGDRLLSFALTEPGVGSDAANLATTARRDGESWVLRGEKASITFAGNADGCVVFARTGGPAARGVSMIFVPLDAPGVARQRYDSVGGHLTQRGSLFFDDVRVPLENQIGEEGTGFIEAMKSFDFNRALIALASVGAARQSLDETVEYAKQRYAFGKPLARHEGVSFQVAEHLALLHAARLVAYETLARADAGQPHTAEAAMAKWLGPKLAAEAIHACMLLHGWSGYGNDQPFAQRMLDVMGLEVGDGTPEIMKAIIGRETFGREFTAYR